LGTGEVQEAKDMMYSAQYASGRKSEHRKLIGDTVYEDEDIDNAIEGFLSIFVNVCLILK
jgi:hypothetical protein